MPDRSPQRRDIRTDAAKLLRRRPLSAGELTDRLTARGHEAEPIKALLDELRSNGLIDDSRLANGLADAEVRRNASDALVTDRLARRGINAESARTAVMAAAQEQARTDRDRALELAKAQLRRQLAGQPIQVQARRLAGVLARRGHDDDTIESVIAQLCPGTADPLSSPESPPEP